MKMLFIFLTLINLVLSCQTSNVPRPEYPRPQFERSAWINLNGEWTYSFDFGKSGYDKSWMNKDKFDGKIIVPFCPESKLSGVEYKDFIEHMWYQRNIIIPEIGNAKSIILNLALNYESEVFMMERSVAFIMAEHSSFGYVFPIGVGQKVNIVVIV